MNPDALDQLLRDLLGMEPQEAINHLVQQELSFAPSMQRDFAKILNNQEEWTEAEPGSFTTHIQEHWDRAVGEKIQTLLPAIDAESQTRIVFLYQHYSFFKSTLTNVIHKKRDLQTAEVKALWLINNYQNYLLTGVLPTNEDFLLQQYMFGTPKQWMDLCDSLQELYEGNPNAYIQHMIVLTS